MRLVLLLCVVTLLVLGGCGGGGGTPSGPSAGDGSLATSHNAGRDCLQCHGFSVAGTVYRSDGSPHQRALVRLSTQPGGAGTVVLSLTTDGSGNFHTSQALSWDAGLYADVTGSAGAYVAMAAPVTGGACNGCHAGASALRLD